MCKTKDEAKAKMDRLIESMDRLAAALAGPPQPIVVNVFNAPAGTTVKETSDASGRRIDVLIGRVIGDAIAGAFPAKVAR